MHQRRVAPDKRAAQAVQQHDEFIHVHTITKNVQSIRDPSRLEDFLVELNHVEYDVARRARKDIFFSAW